MTNTSFFSILDESTASMDTASASRARDGEIRRFLGWKNHWVTIFFVGHPKKDVLCKTMFFEVMPLRAVMPP